MTYQVKSHFDDTSFEELVADCQALFQHADETQPWATGVSIDATVVLPDVPSQSGPIVITPETAALVAGYPEYGG